MKRFVDYYLQKWKVDTFRQPLLLHGARQIGKTYAARQLGKTYPDFVEVNLELLKDAPKVFDRDLTPEEILPALSVLVKKPIKPGKTLLFIDEIQAVPRAIKALRYFYEMMPELHVIAAGSLLDFTLEEHGAPVGRVQSLYMYPMSFIEFLVALDETILVEHILSHTLEKELSEIIHTKLLDLVGQYVALGGMPQVVSCWQKTRDPLACTSMHNRILEFYRQDFGKYSRTKQIKYVRAVFNTIPFELGKKFKHSSVEGGYRKRELSPALDLLSMASVAHKIFSAPGQGLPLGSRADLKDYKAILLDVGLTRSTLDLDLADWFLNPRTQLANKGSITEAFIGQELLAYSNPHVRKNLYFWKRDTPGSQAEVDYIAQANNAIIPIEVKSGHVTTLRSIRSFLESHSKSPYGIRFSTNNYSIFDHIHSYPLYAVAHVASKSHRSIKPALEAMLA